MNILLISDSENFGGVAKATRSLKKGFIDNGVTAEDSYIKNGFLKFLAHIFYIFHKSNEFDAMILMHFKAIALGIIVGIFKKTTMINVIHTDLVGYYNSCNLIKKLILRIILLFIRKKPIVFVSKEAEKRAVSFFNLDNTTCIYNIVEPITTKNLTKKKTTFILGSVSRLHQTKNIDFLIKIFCSLTKDYPSINALLKIYGDGEELSKLQLLTNKLHASNKITFMGYEPNTTAIYSEIDALISFSSIEGFGLTILESLSHQKPVFHTACHCGPSELLVPQFKNIKSHTPSYQHSDFGFLVPPINSRQFSLEEHEKNKEYIKSLEQFISYYKKYTPKPYDFSPFSSTRIIKSWLSLLNFSYT